MKRLFSVSGPIWRKYMYQTFSLFKIGVMIISIMAILGACATNSVIQPEDQAVNFEQEEQDYHALLKMYSIFRGTTENENIKLEFDFTDEKFFVLKSKYGLDTIAGIGDNLSKALNLLFWLCEHTDHFGSYDNHVPMNSLDLLEYAYDQGDERGLNCLNLSYILTECLLSIGLPARTVLIFPFSPRDSDNHVVTHVYIEDLDKWIMLDPTYNAYFKDADENILNLVELRGLLADGQDVFLNDEFSYNGTRLITDAEHVQYYKQYMAKDLFYFTIFEKSGFGRVNSGRNLVVNPEGFNLFEWTMDNVEYRIEFARTYEDIDEVFRESYIKSSTQQLEQLRKYAQENDTGYLCVSLEDFLAKPIRK
jgi:hypothetical protein